MALLDGLPVFGLVNHVVHRPRPNAHQLNIFFGINGEQSVFGGMRGRIFEISGVFVADDISDLNALETALLSYADGNVHTLVDDRLRVWSNVIFRGEYTPSEMGPRPLPGGGFALPFTCTMEGLT
jgi:hypothetical protein